MPTDATQTQIESPTIPTPPVATIAADDLDTVRSLILSANPDIVPELVRGTTIAELTASVPDAINAYTRIAQAMTGTPPAAPATGAPPAPDTHAAVPATPVPAGAAQVVVEMDKIPPAEKIRRGLELMHQRAQAR